MAKRNKTIIVVIAVIVAGLYFVNRYWITPVTAHHSASDVRAPGGGAPDGKYPAAPAFSVTDIFGHELSLANYRGKVVMLDFWATWCGPCRMEIPGFVQLQKEYGAQGFQIVGISMDDDPQPVREFYQQFRMDYPVAMGTDSIGQLYGGIIGLPTTFLIGRDGRIYDKVPGAIDAQRFESEIKTLLATPASAEVKNFQAAGESADVETPAEANSAVPGIDLTKLNKTEVAQYEDVLKKHNCTCGCGYTLLQCRKVDSSCEVSREMAKDQLQKLKKPTPRI